MYKVILAKNEHIEIIAEFNRQMALETETIELKPETIQAGVSAVLKDPTKGFYLVCESESEVVACLMITTEWSDWRNGDIWWLQSVYVHPDHRQKGVFSLLYKHLKEMIREREDIAGLRLYVDEHNQTAIKTYIALGMETSNYQMLEFMK
ncbi:MAG: GNAT family N-acetyltransferase [Candidatus Marinimicrobia bacterium]|nr:GNAT family N-acetyltransferase [Candidatus Neomarinimicrobiota bacterium]MCF7903875.1 GNAT family N-acetyltransferase [Candidatus Neomarinimicrobiota bacterium]